MSTNASKTLPRPQPWRPWQLGHKMRQWTLLGWAIALLLSGPAAGHNGKTAMAVAARGITIDGDFSDWPPEARAYPVALAEYGASPTDAADLQAFFRVAYDPDDPALLLALEVKDQSLVLDAPGGPTWDTVDGCEIVVAQSHGRGGAAQYTFLGRGKEVTNSGQAHAISRARRDGSSHYYEWRVRLDSKPDSLSGLVLGLEVVVTDKDADGSYSWVGWGRYVGKHREPKRRGDVMLAPPASAAGILSGKVARSEDGQGISATRIRIETVDRPGTWVRVDTDRQGRFSVELPAAAYRVFAEVAGATNASLVQLDRNGIQTHFDLPPAQGDTIQARATAIETTGEGERHGAWHRLGVADGLAFGTIWSILQGERGGLWLGSDKGLVRFDGTRTTQIHPTTGQPLGAVRALAKGRDDQLWLGTASGLHAYSNGVFISYTTADGMVDSQVDVLAGGRDGLWIGTPGGLSRLADGHFTNLTIEDGLPSSNIMALADAGDGAVWVGTTSGLCLVEKDMKISFQTAPGRMPVRTLASFQNQVWVGTNAGLWHFDQKRWTSVDIGPEINESAALFSDTQGRLWISTGRLGYVASGVDESPRLFCLQDGSVDNVSLINHLDDVGIMNMLEDREAIYGSPPATVFSATMSGASSPLGKTKGWPAMQRMPSWRTGTAISGSGAPTAWRAGERAAPIRTTQTHTIQALSTQTLLARPKEYLPVQLRPWPRTEKANFG
jgi:hypothetical protein